jgi:hypothetical protein
MLPICENEEKLEKKLIKIISNAGINPKKVIYSSFHELEDSLSIKHYKLTGSNDERSGHIDTYSKSNIEIEEKLKKTLK